MALPHPRPGLSAPATSPWLPAAVAVLACAIRLIHVYTLASVPLFDVLIGDSKRYVEWATTIAGGDWIGTGAFYQAPLYPYLLALLFKAFGTSIGVIRVAQALAGGLACLLIAMAGRHIFDARTGLVAGLLLALYAPAIFF